MASSTLRSQTAHATGCQSVQRRDKPSSDPQTKRPRAPQPTPLLQSQLLHGWKRKLLMAGRTGIKRAHRRRRGRIHMLIARSRCFSNQCTHPLKCGIKSLELTESPTTTIRPQTKRPGSFPLALWWPRRLHSLSNHSSRCMSLSL